LQVENQHHPEPVEAPVNVPEGADLDETRLAYAAAVGRGAEELARLLHGPAEAVEDVTAPEVLVDVIVVPPGGVRRFAVAAGLGLGADDVVDGRDDACEEGVLAVHGGVGGASRGVVNEALEDAVQLAGHVVVDVAEALGHEAEVGGLAPDEQVQARVEQIGARVAVGDVDGGAAAEEAAPGGVVAEQLLADLARDAGLERVGEVGGGEAHLRVGEEEHEVLPLVPDVVALEAEEGAEPVHEVLVGAPLREGRRAEAAHGPERRRGRPHLGEPQRRVLGEEVVDGQDVVGLAARGRRRGGRASLGAARRGHAGIGVGCDGFRAGLDLGSGAAAAREVEGVEAWSWILCKEGWKGDGRTGRCGVWGWFEN
jgi:hypothetical protein